MKVPLLLTFLASLFLRILADGGDDEFVDDPYLKYRPAFARSLPIQIMLTGVVLTLVAVLFIHLMFTAQYHWPLAPVNYVLQLSGVTTLLISLIATIHVVLSATLAESEKWPYMLSYIAVNVPPLDLETDTESWSIAERATWLVMNASTSGLIQITHIQFLTLLYPSRLEGRLIFALLGPLAIVAAVMQLLPIGNRQNVSEIASAVRNVCNATLSLLFTLALFIWGLLVNRKQAWRMDGGTAVFGCAALSLAVISTALNFLYVHKAEEFVWLPGLMWAVVLWQSFLGWWWWVGAGSARAFSSEDETLEEKLRKGAKRERKKREARERRNEKKVKAQKMWKGVAGAFVPNSTSSVQKDLGSSGTRSRTSSPTPYATSDHSSSHHQNSPTSDPTAPRSGARRPRMARRDTDETVSSISHASSMTMTGSFTGTPPTVQTYSTLPRMLPHVVHQWYAALRREHNAAARMQAEERVQCMREMGRQRESAAVGVPGEGAKDVDGEEALELPSVVGWGWGWHGFGWRRRAVEGRRGGGKRGVNEEKYSSEKSRSRSRSRGRRRSLGAGVEYEMRGSRRRDYEEEDNDNIYASDAGADTVDVVREPDQEPTRREREADRRQEHQNAVNREQIKRPERRVDTPPNSVWWWGPLKKWRLKDSTIY